MIFAAKLTVVCEDYITEALAMYVTMQCCLGLVRSPYSCVICHYILVE